MLNQLRHYHPHYLLGLILSVSSLFPFFGLTFDLFRVNFEMISTTTICLRLFVDYLFRPELKF